VVAGLGRADYRFVSEYLLPLVTCPCCGKVNAGQPPPAYPGSISYGPGTNTAAALPGRRS
jgi:hypothetical protein